MSLKRYVSGAWQAVGFLRRYASGAWQNCSFARKYYNGAWQTVYAPTTYLIQNGSNVNNCMVKVNTYVSADGTYSGGVSSFYATNSVSWDITIASVGTSSMIDLTKYQKLVINATVNVNSSECSFHFGIYKGKDDSMYTQIFHKNTAYENHSTTANTGVTEFDISGYTGNWYVGMMPIAGVSSSSVRTTTTNVTVHDLYLI